MVASFNLSYRHLKPEMKRVFRALSIFPADFDASAEQYVCKDKGHKNLSDLVRWSLVEYGEADKRYRLHDLVRIFADERFNEEDSATNKAMVQQLYSNRYMAIISKTGELYRKGGENILDALALFDQELSNIQAGRAWAEKNAKINAKAANLLSGYSMSPYLIILRLPPHTKIEWISASLDAARLLKNLNEQGIHLGNLGLVYSDQGDIRKAIECHEQALAISRKERQQKWRVRGSK